MPTATAMPDPQPVVMERPAPGRFYATSQKALNPVDPHRRAEANIDALRVIAQLRDQQRHATRDEQAVIARFSGWGALPHLFDDDPDWDGHRAQLRGLLDQLHPAGWEAASAATLNSHYSDADIAAVTWDLLRGCGLANHPDGTPIRVFEPGVGSGVFLSTAPKQLNLAWYGVDIDPSAVAVARALHPHATIDHLGLEQVAAPDDTFDLVIGNVPFGNYKLIDPRHNKVEWTVHHHAVYKAVCLTRPGGLVALLCSHYLADVKATAVRVALDGLADLIGIVRFPNRTFERAAGTHAIEDLLIFRRRPAGCLPAAEQALVDGLEPPPSWIETTTRMQGSTQYRINAAMADLAKARSSLAGVVQERDVDRQAFAEQQRVHAAERQRMEERTAGTERRLLEDVDRNRQEAKAARNGLADAQRLQDGLREKVETLTVRDHEARVEIAALTERLAAASLRESDLSQALKAHQDAVNAHRAKPPVKTIKRASVRSAR